MKVEADNENKHFGALISSAEAGEIKPKIVPARSGGTLPLC